MKINAIIAEKISSVNRVKYRIRQLASVAARISSSKAVQNPTHA